MLRLFKKSAVKRSNLAEDGSFRSGKKACLPSAACFRCSNSRAHEDCFFTPRNGPQQASALALVSISHNYLQERDADFRRVLYPARMGYKRLTNPKPLPELGWTAPMECSTVSTLPEGETWTYEVMHDGYRAQAIHNPSGLQLLANNGKDVGGHFAHLLPDLATAFPSGAKIDGVLVALDERGNPSYQLLQNAVANRAPLIFYAVDLLALAGRDMTARLLEERRLILQTFMRQSDSVQLTEAVKGRAQDVLNTARKNRLEGVIAKQEDSAYQPGQRSGAWVKMHLSRRQAFLICGFTRGSYGFDELAIGFYRAGQLRHCAFVRDGFVPDTRRAVYARMARLVTRQCPFAQVGEHTVDAHNQERFAEKLRSCVWIRPELVAQFGFLEWTTMEQLRHAKFLGLRDDKNPRAVIREA